MKKLTITAAIVLYNEHKPTLQKTINSFLAIPESKKLFLIDNSKNDSLKELANHPDIEYYYSDKNLGFGKAHNTITSKIVGVSDYHLVLNPDVSFNPKTISSLISQLKKDHNLSMIAPKVLFPNKKHQYTARKYPAFFDLIIRRLNCFKKRIYKHEYRYLNLSESLYVDYLTGCFQLYNTSDFIKIGGFDERYFLYMEDVDICKKIDLIGKKKLYYPKVTITHVLKQGSSKSFKLFFYHLSSAIKYFVKWNIFPPKNKVNS